MEGRAAQKETRKRKSRWALHEKENGLKKEEKFEDYFLKKENEERIEEKEVEQYYQGPYPEAERKRSLESVLSSSIERAVGQDTWSRDSRGRKF